jgi:hypothetical protein
MSVYVTSTVTNGDGASCQPTKEKQCVEGQHYRAALVSAVLLELNAVPGVRILCNFLPSSFFPTSLSFSRSFSLPPSPSPSPSPNIGALRLNLRAARRRPTGSLSLSFPFPADEDDDKDDDGAPLASGATTDDSECSSAAGADCGKGSACG